jgi:ribosomal-protein-alanine N-acetyltransferase
MECVSLQHRHLDALVNLHEQCFAKAWGKDSFIQALEGGARHCIVAMVNDQVVGGILWQQVVDEAEIITVFTDASSRGQGVGGGLLKALGEHSDDVTRVFLEVNHNNDAAVGLYEKHGYMTVGVRQGYYTDGPDGPQDALLMECVLNR